MRIRKLIDKILGVVLAFVMGVLVLDVLWQVLSRYIMNSPSSFTDELAGFLLIWVGLLGAAYITGTKGHLAIDLLPQKLSGDKLRKLNLFINIIMVLFAVTVLVVGGSWLVYTRFVFGQISAALQINLGYVYMVLPLSGVLIVFYGLNNSYLEFKNQQL